MHFQTHNTHHLAQAGVVHPFTSSSSTSWSSISSNHPTGWPFNSSHSDIAAHPSFFLRSGCYISSDTVFFAPRSPSLLPPVGQVRFRSPSELASPPPLLTVLASSGSDGSESKHVFSGQKEGGHPSESHSYLVFNSTWAKETSFSDDASALRTTDIGRHAFADPTLQAPVIPHYRTLAMFHPSIRLFLPGDSYPSRQHSYKLVTFRTQPHSIPAESCSSSSLLQTVVSGTSAQDAP